MPRNDDGEFELILGNKQLLSVFFIVVVLLGVFFTMGYIVGRNSAPVGATETASRRNGDSKPIVVDSPSAAGGPASEAAKPVEDGKPLSPGEVSQPPQTAEARPPEVPVTAPVQTAPVTKPAEKPVVEKPSPRVPEKPVEEKKPEVKKPEERPMPKPADLGKLQPGAAAKPNDSVRATPVAPRVSEPASGLYLQVTAVKRPEAEALAEILLKKGFPAVLTPSSKESLFRVLVGPLKDTATAAKTKSDLEALGTKNPFVQRF